MVGASFMQTDSSCLKGTLYNENIFCNLFIKQCRLSSGITTPASVHFGPDLSLGRDILWDPTVLPFPRKGEAWDIIRVGNLKVFYNIKPAINGFLVF